MFTELPLSFEIGKYPFKLLSQFAFIESSFNDFNLLFKHVVVIAC